MRLLRYHSSLLEHRLNLSMLRSQCPSAMKKQNKCLIMIREGKRSPLSLYQ